MFKLAIVLVMAFFSCASMAKSGKTDSLIIGRIFMYKQLLKDKDLKDTASVYIRYSLKTIRRNPTLMCVPSMYVIAKGNREYAGETYTKAIMEGDRLVSGTRQVNVGTVPRHRYTMPAMAQYMTPHIYNVSMIDNNLLSPFNKHNRHFYRYILTPLTSNRIEVAFLPKLYNTQLVSGKAIAEFDSGRIISVDMNAEFDMIKLKISIVMGESGYKSLFPESLDITADFGFIGNKITSDYHAVYGQKVMLADTIVNCHDMALMDSIRPEPLPAKERAIYNKFDSLRANRTTPTEKKRNKWKTILWDIIGDNLVNRIQGHFGTQDQGYWRISPILNPLYLGYSGNKGLTYKSKIRLHYVFTTNSFISLYLKGGYSFKQRQVYLTIPLRYTFNNRRNGYAEIEIGNGNRITNSSVLDEIKGTSLDSIEWSNMGLNYFKDMYLNITANYDFSDKFSVQPGVVFHRRSAVDKQAFVSAGKPTDYRSFAPTLQLQYRPFGWKGVAITTDYERGISNVGKADMEYERVEIDASWIYRPTNVRNVSLRLGTGFYTSKGDKTYFLDYTNFRDDNLVGGWDDDWSGDFQLLNRNWYNASKYYVRTNSSYESPLMILSHLPVVGRFMEVERIYISSLFVEHLHPYIEYGYGFSNRLFSMGLFCATRNRTFDGFGVKVGFELFSKW